MPTNIQRARPGAEHFIPGDLRSLDAVMAGSVIAPGDEGWDDALSPYDAGHGFLSFCERDADTRTLYRHEYSYCRLRVIKASYDPDDLLQSNHPIPPAR